MRHSFDNQLQSMVSWVHSHRHCLSNITRCLPRAILRACDMLHALYSAAAFCGTTLIIFTIRAVNRCCRVDMCAPQVYRACRDCLLLGCQPKGVLPHCPRACCNATNVRVGKPGWHASGTSLEPHFAMVESGQFTIKFRLRKKKKKVQGAKAPRVRKTAVPSGEA